MHAKNKKYIQTLLEYVDVNLSTMAVLNAEISANIKTMDRARRRLLALYKGVLEKK